MECPLVAFGQLSYPCEPHVWREVERLLTPSLGRSGEDMDVVCAELGCGLAQLWAAIEGREMKLALVTRLDGYMDGVRCLIWHLGGRDRYSWLEYQDEIAKWAKAEGCIEMEAHTRPGFARELTRMGWRPHTVTVRKALV